MNDKPNRYEKPFNLVLHTYMVFELGARGVSQATLAKICGTSPCFLNKVISGRKTSAEVQRRIAVALGFNDWQGIELAAADFQRKLSAPTKREA